MSRMNERTGKAVTLRAHFDGERIRLDEPLDLKPDTPLTVTVWPQEDLEREEWARLSIRNLENAYGEDEPEYSLDMIRRPNPSRRCRRSSKTAVTSR
jgi:hypothetical protein